MYTPRKTMPSLCAPSLGKRQHCSYELSDKRKLFPYISYCSVLVLPSSALKSPVSLFMKQISSFVLLLCPPLQVFLFSLSRNLQGRCRPGLPQTPHSVCGQRDPESSWGNLLPVPVMDKDEVPGERLQDPRHSLPPLPLESQRHQNTSSV